MIEKGNICYWCGNKSTTMEHVPPKCLFPEEKDTYKQFQKFFRVNLIKVPSCDEHNNKKSGDDEYLLACLAGILGNNSLAFFQNSTKIARALKRNKNLIDARSSHKIKLNGRIFPISKLTANNFRLVSSFESIARGLYYYSYSKIFKGKCTIYSSIFANTIETEWNKFNEKAVMALSEERQSWKTEIKGSNPDVFTYQFSLKDSFNTQTIAMTFYDNKVVFVILSAMTKEEIENYRIKYKKTLDSL